jgi:signal transduction histidine kinase
MRPPALDELGLVPALQQYAQTLRTPDDQPFTVAFDTHDLPVLSAAWEVAAYRIVAAALDNAALHSGGSAATAHLEAADGTLLVEVADDGRAPTERWRPGVGLTSMRERAAELGGTLTIDATHHGWTVRAAIPLPAGKTISPAE